MRGHRGKESGQTIVEFAIIALVMLMLTMGLVDVGRAFFEYTEVSNAARFGARWGGVVGGTCIVPGVYQSDWCTQQGLITGGSKTAITDFWAQTGSIPRQGNGTKCPTYSSTPSDYYTVSDPDNDSDNDYSSDTDSDPSTKQTTIVGAIGQHFDTSSSTTSTVLGQMAGIDMTKVYVCIETSDSSADQKPGDYVGVVVYYHFNPVSFIVARSGFDLVAKSQYEVE